MPDGFECELVFIELEKGFNKYTEHNVPFMETFLNHDKKVPSKPIHHSAQAQVS